MESPTVAPEQTNTTNRPETAAADVEFLTGALSFEDLESLRTSQRDAFYAAMEQARQNGLSSEDAIDQANNAARQVNHAYLDQILQSDIGSNNSAAVESILQKYSFVQMSDADWYAARRDENGDVVTQSGIQQLEADVATLAAQLNPAEVEAPAASEASIEAVDPAIEAARGQLEGLRDRLSTLSAKRQGRLFGEGGEKYQEADQAYKEQIQKLGRLELATELADESLSETDKNALVIAFLFAEQQELRQQTTEKLKGTTVGRFVEWMNKGGALKRLGKGVLIGAAAGVVGAGIGTAAGVAGVAALGAGIATGATMATRFARGFASADARKGRGMKELGDDHAVEARENAEVAENEDALARYARFFDEKFEEDTRNEQSKRRKSVAWGLGGVALGAGIAGTAAALIDTGVFDGHSVRNDPVYGGLNAEAQPADTTPEGDAGDSDGSAEEPLDDGAQESDELPANTDQDARWDEQDNAELLPDPSFVIENGEGGIHFFQRIGLSEAQWYSVAGELLNQFPGDFYAYGSDVRLSHPGQLSLEAQEFIKGRFGL